MKSTARHHHYLPQCYLRCFTTGHGRAQKLRVFDLKRRRIFETVPRNVGGRRDFNRVEIDGVRPDAVETALSSFEEKVSKALRSIQETKAFTGETRDVLLNFIALLAIRSPQRREQWRKFQSEIVEHMMDLMLASKERWDASTSGLGELESEGLGNVTYEDMKAFHDGGQYTIDIPTESHISIEMEGVDTLLPLLYQRKWLLFESASDTCPFVTTDHPVVLIWNHPEQIPPFYRQSPGFGLKDTTVQVALTKRIALVGEFDGQEGALGANEQLVAAFNSRALMFANEQVYASRSSFLFMTGHDSIHEGKHIFSVLSDAQQGAQPDRP